MNYYLPKLCFLLTSLVLSCNVSGQSIRQEKMEQLAFMIGDWIGTSTIYEDGVVSKEVPAFQQISYDLNKSIIVIQLHSELLRLHTIIRYNETDATYYYYPFSERGTNRYPAVFHEGKLIVQPSETNRFIFSKLTEGGFQEYGERLTNGNWVKYFEDNFKLAP